MRNKNIAVVGCGYWGKNLVRNFFELGSLKSLYDYDDNTDDDHDNTHDIYGQRLDS